MSLIPHLVLAAYGLDNQPLEQEAFGTGLINHTWKIKSQKEEFILQSINQDVFKVPEDIAENIQLVGGYLKQHFPEYLFVMPVQTKEGHSPSIRSSPVADAAPN